MERPSRGSLISRREILRSSALGLGGCVPVAILGNRYQGLDQTNKSVQSNRVAAGRKVHAVETPRNTYEIVWEGGKLELNLIPMNQRAVEANEYKVSYSKGKIIDGMADAVGIVGLRLGNVPPIRRICWDSREHQLWTGFPGGFGGFHLRNVVVQAPRVDQLTDGSVQVSCTFVAMM